MAVLVIEKSSALAPVVAPTNKKPRKFFITVDSVTKLQAIRASVTNPDIGLCYAALMTIREDGADAHDDTALLRELDATLDRLLDLDESARPGALAAIASVDPSRAERLSRMRRACTSRWRRWMA